MKRLRVASSAGFCFGVKRAVNMAEAALDARGYCYSVGPLIHNGAVVDALSQRGMRVIGGAEEVPEGAAVIIRSHGASQEEIEALEGKNAEIIDATCPKVSRIHGIVHRAGDSAVIVIGDEQHPEVRAIRGWCRESYVFPDDHSLEKWLSENPKMRDRTLTVVFQTTLIEEKLVNCKKILKKECTKLNIFDTICNATILRQEEARKLAKQCDAMVVIGDKQSANSAHLARISGEYCERVQFIESAAELNICALDEAAVIGITAGASAPAWIIKEVKQKMTDELEIIATTDEQTQETTIAEDAVRNAELEETAELETMAETAEQEMATETLEQETATEVAELESETVESAETADAEADQGPPSTDERSETEKSFAELLEDSIKTINNGDTVTGIVAAITPTEVSVDLETKHSGYIPLSEFTDDPEISVDEIVKVGDKIEAYVVRVNDVEGTVMLSKRRLDAVKSWNDIENAYREGIAVEGTVSEDNKGGVVVLINGVRVFVPASQTGLSKDTPMSELVRQKVRLKLTEVNRARRRVVGSIRAIQHKERKERAEKIWQEIEEGKKYQGTIKSLTSYGAFVDIGGIDGMVHVSELSWSRIRQPSEVVSVGDNIEVYVLGFDRENKKISLGYKDPDANPWIRFNSTYRVGDIVSVKVVKLMPFGAFAEVLPGVDGLIHISQIANRRIGKPDEVLSVGDFVNVKITNIDDEKQKISLSIRALSEPDPIPPRREDEREVESSGYDALVYEVSSSGVATGEIPEE